MTEIENLDFWYSGQMYSYLQQFVAMFSGFQYETGYGRDGKRHTRRVPCKLAMTDNQVAAILRNNSENTLNAVPQITIWPTSISFDRRRLQNPFYTEQSSVYEKDIDPETGLYTNDVGNRFTVDRIMAMPFELTVQVDIWTSNLDQKFQLFEQIVPNFAAGLNLQTSDNPLDWTSLTVVELRDTILTNRSIPIGNSNEIDVMTLTLWTVVHISLPARVRRLKIIETIIHNIHTQVSNTADPNIPSDPDYVNKYLMGQVIVSPGNHCISVESNEITLLNSHAALHDMGDVMVWEELFKQYGATFKPGVNIIRLNPTENMDDRNNDVWGVVDIHPDEPNKLLVTWDMDSLPVNTQASVLGIINPSRTFPGNNLPTPKNGDRYLINDDISPTSPAWGGFSAKSNDIIQHVGGSWQVVWSESHESQIEYMVNTYTGKQLKWLPDGEGWRLSLECVYRPGFWKVILT